MRKELEQFPRCTELIHGGARGADKMADEIGRELGFIVVEVPADWDKYGRSAGAIRNREMLDMKPDLVIAFPTAESRGTWNCVNEARRRGIKVKIVDDVRETQDLVKEELEKLYNLPENI